MSTIWEDLKRLLAGRAMFRLSTLLTTRLVPIFYATGLAAIGLWAIDHLVWSFTAFNFGQGLWGLLEILVYGTLMLVTLRIVSELLLIHLGAHRNATGYSEPAGLSPSLLDEVREAIHELAEAEDDGISPATDPAPYVPGEAYPDIDEGKPAPQAKRTAKRNPPAPRP